jgi:hypothetical protein
MIELSNTNAQILAAGQSVAFDTVLLHTGCGECHRPNSSAVNLAQKNAIYEVSFNANIGGTAAGNGQIAITLDQSPLSETTGKVVTTTAGDLQSVSGSTFVQTCRCNSANTILLTNTGTTAINVDENGRLSIKRIA